MVQAPYSPSGPSGLEPEHTVFPKSEAPGANPATAWASACQLSVHEMDAMPAENRGCLFEAGRLANPPITAPVNHVRTCSGGRESARMEPDWPPVAVPITPHCPCRCVITASGSAGPPPLAHASIITREMLDGADRVWLMRRQLSPASPAERDGCGRTDGTYGVLACVRSLPQQGRAQRADQVSRLVYGPGSYPSQCSLCLHLVPGHLPVAEGCAATGSSCPFSPSGIFTYGTVVGLHRHISGAHVLPDLACWDPVHTSCLQ